MIAARDSPVGRRQRLMPATPRDGAETVQTIAAAGPPLFAARCRRVGDVFAADALPRARRALSGCVGDRRSRPSGSAHLSVDGSVDLKSTPSGVLAPATTGVRGVVEFDYPPPT
jgi:hypothetical protein